MEMVLDASLALAWSLPDEASPTAERVLARLSSGSILWVPALWWYEIANALTMAQRQRRLTEADCVRAMGLYGMLPIGTDVDLNQAALGRLYTLASRHALSAYDAAYLELAQRRAVGIATLDRHLRLVAGQIGLEVVTR
jgi:predicted nucleic acid-binding protein